MACRFSFPLSSLTAERASRTPRPRQAGRRTNGHGEDHQEDRDGPSPPLLPWGVELTAQVLTNADCVTEATVFVQPVFPATPTRTRPIQPSMRTMLRRQTASAVGACAPVRPFPPPSCSSSAGTSMSGSGVHFWASACSHPRDGRRARAHDRPRNDARMSSSARPSRSWPRCSRSTVATPGMIMGYEGGLGAFTGGATLLLGAAVLALPRCRP